MTYEDWGCRRRVIYVGVIDVTYMRTGGAPPGVIYVGV